MTVDRLLEAIKNLGLVLKDDEYKELFSREDLEFALDILRILYVRANKKPGANG